MGTDLNLAMTYDPGIGIHEEMLADLELAGGEEETVFGNETLPLKAHARMVTMNG